jgi:hypothetical protein
VSDDAAKLLAFKDARDKLRERRAEFLRLTEPFLKIAAFVELWKRDYSKLVQVQLKDSRPILLEEGLLDFDNRTKQIGLSKYSMEITRAYQQWKTAVEVALAAHQGLSEEDKKMCPLENVSL